MLPRSRYLFIRPSLGFTRAYDVGSPPGKKITPFGGRRRTRTAALQIRIAFVWLTIRLKPTIEQRPGIRTSDELAFHYTNHSEADAD
jgi:hypothetical protein